MKGRMSAFDYVLISIFICRIYLSSQKNVKYICVHFYDVVILLICNNKLNIFQLNRKLIITWDYRLILSCMPLVFYDLVTLLENKNSVLGGSEFLRHLETAKKGTSSKRIFFKVCKECLRGINNLYHVL